MDVENVLASLARGGGQLASKLERMERELSDGGGSWPDVMGELEMAVNQLAQLHENATVVLGHFAFAPLRAPANGAGAFPLMLRTRPLPEMEAAEAELRARAEGVGREEAAAGLRRHNEAVEQAQATFSEAQRQLLQEMQAENERHQSAAAASGQLRPGRNSASLFAFVDSGVASLQT